MASKQHTFFLWDFGNSQFENEASSKQRWTLCNLKHLSYKTAYLWENYGEIPLHINNING